MGEAELLEMTALRAELTENRLAVASLTAAIDTWQGTSCLEHGRRLDDLETRERARDREINLLIGKLIGAASVVSGVVSYAVSMIRS